MRDELFDRDYQEARAMLNNDLNVLFARVARFFTDTGEAQVRAEWSAPWRRSQRKRRSGVA